MRRSVVAVGLIGLLVGAVVLASLVEARIGGGGSSGSRGSRSYSAPRVPSSPLTPSTPASPQRPAGPSAPGSLGQTPRPGLLGGLGGMLGGFLLGGLVGSMLFGGLGGFGGGIGLMDLLVMAGLAALAISFLRRRAPQPAPASAYSGAALDPAETRAVGQPEAAAGRAASGARSPSDEDLAGGLEHIRAMDPDFDPARFLGIAKDFFVRLQIGWSAGDLAAVRAHLTDEMAAALEGDLARLRERRRRNRVDQVAVDSIALSEAWQEYGRDLVTVEIRAGAIDCVVDEATGQVVEGSATTPTRFVEYWTFVRPVGPNPWRLGAIQQPSA